MKYSAFLFAEDGLSSVLNELHLLLAVSVAFEQLQVSLMALPGKFTQFTSVCSWTDENFIIPDE